MSQVIVPPTPAATIAAGISLPLIGGVLVGLRFYFKRLQHGSLFVEDWLTLPAFLLVLGLGICLIYGVKKRALAHPTPQPADPQDLPTFIATEITINRQLEYAVLMIQIPAITCVKLGFLFFYKRIFCTPMGWRLRYLLWCLIIFCIVWGVAFFFSFVFICGTHFTALWGNLLQFKQYCSQILTWNMWFSTSDFALDVIIFFFPMPLLWRLQMSTTHKLAVLAIFMVGGLTLAASITRMVIFVRAVQNLKKAYKSKGADNGVITAGLYWTTFECGMGLIAVCLPPVYGLFKQLLAKTFGLGSKCSTKPSKKVSSRFSDIALKRDGHVQLDAGSETDMIPLGRPVVTTDIYVEVTDGNTRAYAEAGESGRNDW